MEQCQTTNSFFWKLRTVAFGSFTGGMHLDWDAHLPLRKGRSEASEDRVVHALGYPLKILSCLDSGAPWAEILESVLGDKVYATPSAILAEGHGLQFQTHRTALLHHRALPPAVRRDSIIEE